MSGTISGTLTFDPAIGFNMVKIKPQHKMTVGLSIGNVDLGFNREAFTRQIDFT
jgi:hypothetical protein